MGTSQGRVEARLVGVLFKDKKLQLQLQQHTEQPTQQLWDKGPDHETYVCVNSAGTKFSLTIALGNLSCLHIHNAGNVLGHLAEHGVCGIPKVFLTGMTDLGPALCCHWIEGNSLWDVVMKQGPLSSSVVVRYHSQLQGILKKIHMCGVLHLDVTPLNIVVGKDGVYLIDFGAAVKKGCWDVGGSASCHPLFRSLLYSQRK